MKPLKIGQLVKLRYISRAHNSETRRKNLQSKVPLSFRHKKPMTAAPATTKTQEYDKIRPQPPPPQRLAIILQEAEEIDLDLYHKCWVFPHEPYEEAPWHGEFWFKREELEIIQQEEELQSAPQV